MHAFLKLIHCHAAVFKVKLREIIKVPDDPVNIELCCPTTVELLCAVTQIKSSLWSQLAHPPLEYKEFGGDPEVVFTMH